MKSKVYSLSMQESEKEILNRASECLSLSVSSFIRMICLAKAKEILNQEEKNGSRENKTLSE